MSLRRGYSGRPAGLAALLCLTAALTLAPAPTSAAAAPAPETTEIRGLLRGGRYAEAEQGARALLRELEQIHGHDSAPVADALDLLAESLRLGGKGGKEEALAVCQRALKARTAGASTDSLAFASSLHNLGALYLVRGDFGQARPPLEQVLALRLRLLGEKDPLVAQSLLYLANLEFSLGRENIAKPLAERAVAIHSAALPSDDPALASSLTMLAGIHYSLGEFTEAGEIWERVLSIRSLSLGADHPLVGECEHNLGGLYTEMGDLAEGRRHLERALRIRVKRLGHQHANVASTLQSLAACLEDQGDLLPARDRYREALAILKSVYRGDHPDEGWTLMRLGRLEMTLGNWPAASRSLREALQIQMTTLGEGHPDIAWTLAAMAAVARRDRRLEDARRLCLRAIDIQSRAYGPSHPDLAVTLARYADVLAASGDSALALESALRSATIRAEHLRLTAAGLSERQALAYATVGPSGLATALAIVGRGQATGTPDAIRSTWEQVIATRTTVLDEVARRQIRSGGNAGDTLVARASDSLRDARQRLANLLVRGAAGETPERYRALLERARNEAERSERALAAASRGYRQGRLEARAGWGEIVEALPDRWCLVAYATCELSGARSYVAFVLKDRSSAPAVFHLGSTTEIDTLISLWRSRIEMGAGQPSAASDALCRRAGLSLRKRLWDPVETIIGEAAGVFVVPDGAIHFVNFSALPGDSGTYLVETSPLLHYLSSERDLVSRRRHESEGKGLLAVGNPAFDDVSPRPADRTPRGPSGRGEGGRVGVRGMDADCETFADLKFRPLPGAKREVDAILALWERAGEATLLVGREATEGAVKRLAPGHRVLHVATHGFFLDAGSCIAAEGTRRGIGGIGTLPKQPVRSWRGESLFLSGLALAGANRRERLSGTDEDGILTAGEVASLDLSGVEWVVLSACDTGMGRAQTGEGVLGFRRAFEISGARTLIMSLWEADDAAALSWMKELYTARLREHRTTAESVREASRRVLRDRRARGLTTHPFFWGGFIAVGDWN